MLDLLKQVSPLSSEEPEDILIFVRLGEIHSLDLVEDRCFITRIFLLVPRGLLQLLSVCSREKAGWAICKIRVFEGYFPYFVRERLVRDLLAFNFHESGQAVRTYIDRVFQAAEFLQYEASEQQLVDRILKNLHPNILKQAAFLDKPSTRRELIGVIGLIEERMSIAAERQKTENRENKGIVSKGLSGNFRR